VRVRGVVQGVGFRPFVYRLARAHGLTGWVKNEEHGVEIHLEGSAEGIERFVSGLRAEAPAAARISSIEVRDDEGAGFAEFTIRESRRGESPSVRISPDLPVCEACLGELFDPSDARYRYPYINCTNCGPRFSVIESLPYDRAATTMRHWSLDEFCARQYEDPLDRRFHAQPVACPRCGPHYRLDSASDWEGIEAAAALLRAGRVLAVKGIGGYHLSCDAQSEEAVRALRERKFRKEKPFALMAASVEIAYSVVELSPAA
jgi:hydrogenase maturation protein HypF